MKALIRNQGETVTDKDGIVGIDWNTGAPLTNPDWSGGPYQLVQDYTEIADTEVGFSIPECCDQKTGLPSNKDGENATLRARLGELESDL